MGIILHYILNNVAIFIIGNFKHTFYKLERVVK